MRILFGLLSVAALVLSGCAQLVPSQAAPTAWDSLLPHSAKGYELYSWPVQDGQQWQYVLVTGTNRLKSHEEIVPAENATVESGWVRISAAGTEELKSLLSQLPPGESVTWIGGDWLEQVGSLRGNIRLPDPDVLDEIEHHCRQAGVTLSVAP
jgi:hypothetical protein